MKDWKEYNCSVQGCKRNRYNKKLKLCLKHYQTNRIDTKKHKRDLIKFRAKYKYIREAILLVSWYEEYKAADLKKSKIKQVRERYILRSKYNRFSPDILKCFKHGSGKKYSDINHEVVHEYKNHITWLENNDWRCRTVLPKGPNLHLRYHKKIKKKEEEDEKRVDEI